LFHEFVYHPAFSSLRNAATRRRPPVDLPRAFGRLAVRARRGARVSGKGTEDSRNLTDWHQLASRYPKIRRSIPIGLALAADARVALLRPKLLVRYAQSRQALRGGDG
jgi:hypothetical protein